MAEVDISQVIEYICGGCKLKLMEPTMEHEKAIQAFKQEFLSCGGTMDGCGPLRQMDNIKDWVCNPDAGSSFAWLQVIGNI